MPNGSVTLHPPTYLQPGYSNTQVAGNFALLNIQYFCDHDKIKAALRKRFNLTEDGYRLEFRKSETEENENPTQFVIRITMYLEKWMETAKSTNYENLKLLLIIYKLIYPSLVIIQSLYT